jgi:hypothetical protein
MWVCVRELSILGATYGVLTQRGNYRSGFSGGADDERKSEREGWKKRERENGEEKLKINCIHTASCPVGTRGSYPEGKAAGA